MNILFLFYFQDDPSYDVLLNLDELEKQAPTLHPFIQDVRIHLKSGTDSMEAESYIFEEIWGIWEKEGIIPSLPAPIHGRFTLYEI